jgi:hypothetical protein
MIRYGLRWSDGDGMIVDGLIGDSSGALTLYFSDID